MTINEESNEMAKRVKRLSADLKDLKTNQTIGGDSWIVYRHEITYVKPQPSYGVTHSQPVFKITFTPDEAGPFVANILISPSDRTFQANDQDIMPDPNYFGVWYDCGTIGAGWAYTVAMVFATKKGTLTVERVNKTITA